MTWDTEPDRWDTVIIDGIPLTGLWTVQPINGVMRHVQTKKAKGKDGAIHRDHGLQDSGIKLRGQIASEEWEAWTADAVRILPPDEGAEQTPHTISHPLLDVMRIDKVWVLGIKHDPPEDGFMKIEIQLNKWTPKPKDAKTSNKYTENSRSGSKVTAQDQAAYERAIKTFAPPDDLADLSDPSTVSSAYTNQSVITGK